MSRQIAQIKCTKITLTKISHRRRHLPRVAEGGQHQGQDVPDAFPHVRPGHWEEVPRRRHPLHGQPVPGVARTPRDQDHGADGLDQPQPPGHHWQRVCPDGARGVGPHRDAVPAPTERKASWQQPRRQDRILETQLKSHTMKKENQISQSVKIDQCAVQWRD